MLISQGGKNLPWDFYSPVEFLQGVRKFRIFTKEIKSQHNVPYGYWLENQKTWKRLLDRQKSAFQHKVGIMEAIELYESPLFRSINDSLHGSSSSSTSIDQKFVASLEAAFAEDVAKTTEPLIAIRGFRTDHPQFKRMPEDHQPIRAFRSCSWNPYIALGYANRLMGSYPLSWSKDCCLLWIHVSSGVPALAIDHQGEGEILLPPKANLKLKCTHCFEGGKILEVIF